VLVGSGSLRAKIVSNQWLGDQSHLALSVAGKLLVAVSHDRVAAQIGDEIAYELPGRMMHVFDRASGVALMHGVETA
jgi:multiple sugar transport system ATP-binding protein